MYNNKCKQEIPHRVCEKGKRKMKTYKRAQSTLNYEYGLLTKPSKNPNAATVERISKDKYSESYIITHKDMPTVITDVYFGKQGNIIGITYSDENGNITENLELRTA